ncbi:MAG: multicopper oxidase family protein [Gammaproteobacteria bacterium]
MSVSRRVFLKSTAALAQLGWLPWSAVSAAPSPYQLIADKAQKRFMTGEGSADAAVWAYNGSVPGPVLRYRKGDTLSVEFLNLLEEGSTIHWHGIRNLFAMDGVAGLTQAAVNTGETFRYQFPLPDAGTYWYHSHAKAWSQVARGLYGPLIIEDDSDPAVDHDLVLMIDDWRLTESGQIDERSFGSLHDWSHGGRLGNWLTVNGRSKPELSVGVQSRIRLRIINAANARVFGLQLPAPAVLVAEDGYPLPIRSVDYIEVAPAQRADLILDIGSDPLIILETLNGNPITAATLNPVAGTGPRVQKADLPEPALVNPPKHVDQHIAIRMQGGAMGNLSEAVYDGVTYPLRTLAMDHQKLWAFNGVVPKTHDSLARVKRGDVVELEIWNDTGWSHAMHLHGHHFWIKDEGGAFQPGQRDTYLFSRGEKASLVFKADNPGLWLFHCHMFEHHAAGMGAVIEVS